jgi:Dyp-type peroxidase family
MTVDRHDVQGNLVGFNKDHQVFLFLQFPNPESGRAFLASIRLHVATADEVYTFNDLYKRIHDRRTAAHDVLQSNWINIALSFAGLQVLGLQDLEGFDPVFKGGMRAAAERIGDVDDSAPLEWVPPFDQTAHAMVIVAADDDEGLAATLTQVHDLIASTGVTELSPSVAGEVRAAERGHEHFGFKDGISQPNLRGITVASQKRMGTTALGEFLIGYPDQDGKVSGHKDEAATPGQTAYDPPAPQTPALPAWTKNGSFLVFRRLRQDVGGFRDSVTTLAAEKGVPEERLAAKMVGRWKSGAPLERVSGEPATVDPAMEDPSTGTDKSALSDEHINRFGYEQDDADGHAVPRAAHIRKVYPRDQAIPGETEADRHRILRRGIPYGPDFAPGEAPYGGGPVTDDRDRGLLFLCYQSSIERGFEFIQRRWVNDPDFPQAGDGRDPIISQDVNPRDFSIPPDAHTQLQRWVRTTGGEYFFAPSLKAIEHLASGATDA